jgi:general secretion pathway protein A
MNTIQASGNYNFQQILNFFGLSHNPFPMAPDNTDFFISLHHDKVIAKLTQAVFARKGFMLLTGEIGLGKTTLSRRIIHILEQNHVEISLIFQSFYQGKNLLKEIIKDFGIQVNDTQQDISVLMTRLNTFLLEKNQTGTNCAIVIDDAQNLSIESLELIRMISNLEADREKLVQILLIGQPELMDILACHELRQLMSRVALIQHPAPLTKAEIANYLQFKLNRAGDCGKIILSSGAVHRLYKFTQGNIRSINILMDQALQNAFADQSRTIRARHIEKPDLKFESDSTRQEIPRLSALLIFIILIFTGMTAGSGYFLYTHRAAVKKEKIQHVLSDKKTATHETGNTTHITVKSAEHENTAISIPVTNFLSAYGLQNFSTRFHQALTLRNIDRIRDSIFSQTGLQLIKLPVLPDIAKKKFDILSQINPLTQKPEYYLFWKPVVQITQFYPKYHGKQIIELQKLLSRIHLYTFYIDGIVGQRLMKSIELLQKRNHLPETGFPDPETIFVLSCAAGQL